MNLPLLSHVNLPWNCHELAGSMVNLLEGKPTWLWSKNPSLVQIITFCPQVIDLQLTEVPGPFFENVLKRGPQNGRTGTGSWPINRGIYGELNKQSCVLNDLNRKKLGFHQHLRMKWGFYPANTCFWISRNQVLFHQWFYIGFSNKQWTLVPSSIQTLLYSWKTLHL